MVNIKLSFSFLIIFLLVGCTTITPTAKVKLQPHDTIMFEWEDITHKSIQGHFITQQMWQLIQEELINRRINANQCVDINNFGLK